MINSKKLIVLSLSTFLFLSPSMTSKAATLTSNCKASSVQASVETPQSSKSSDTSINLDAVNNGQAVVDYAKKFLNVPYVWGGHSPDGFDCSGFTMYVYAKFGVNLSHSANSQKNAGTYVSRANLKPGDLLCFDWKHDGTVDHVGIYIGNNQFIEAHGTQEKPDKVKITSLTDYYLNGLSTQRRLVH